MFKQKTVFVIGAGASMEFNMPSGESLKNQTGNILSVAKNDDRSMRFRSQLMNIEGSRASALIDAGSNLAATLSSFVSIDEALHYFGGDTNAVRVGKLAIARLILEAEAAI
jgi:hypothetical protein